MVRGSRVARSEQDSMSKGEFLSSVVGSRSAKSMVTQEHESFGDFTLDSIVTIAPVRSVVRA